MRNTLIDTIDSNNRKDDFNGPLLFFSHGSTNPCLEAIGFCESKSLHVIDKKLLLVNLSNSNTESEQIKALDTLKSLLEDIDKISDKKNYWWRFKFSI